MARPKEFDPRTALSAAVQVFWRNGYEKTSLDDLMAAMQVGRQSLYDTFGDKRELYYLILFPRDPTKDRSTREQRQTYARWFEGVALGYDIPGRER